jgi:hypothetical protein
MHNRHKQRYFIAIALCLTLGMAPFFPEPHLFGKWRWLLGGGHGMQAMDWFDLALHSSPFGLLIYFLTADIGARLKQNKKQDGV